MSRKVSNGLWGYDCTVAQILGREYLVENHKCQVMLQCSNHQLWVSKRWEPAGHLFWTLCQPYWEESSAVSVLSLLLVSDSFRRIWHWEVDVAKNLGYVKEPQTSEHSSTKITRQVHDKFTSSMMTCGSVF